MEKGLGTITDLLDVDNTCNICYAEFLDTEDLNIHITQIHLNESSLQRFCKICCCIFSDVESYAIHIRNNHLSTLQWCKYCTRIFCDLKQLKNHEIKHGLTKLECSSCGHSLSNKVDLETHEFSKHKDGEGMMYQDYFAIFSSLLNMNVKEFFAVPYTNTLYTCIICNLSTTDIDVYIQHLKMENLKSFTCSTCYNVYRKKNDLRKHLRKISCSIEKKGKCHKCKKKFETEVLRKHIVNCTQSKTAPHNNILQSLSNYSKTHNNVVPLAICKLCQRQFVGKAVLDRHINTTHKSSLHLYKYKCIECDQIFKHPKFLLVHFSSKHKDLQPYTCKICDKKFRIRKHFTLHIKLDHLSIGYVEFDENYHVFFTDKKSEKPFKPPSLLDMEPIVIQDEATDAKDSVKNSNTTSPLEANTKILRNDIVLVNVNSDYMNLTETECENKISKVGKKKTVKSKRRKRGSKVKFKKRQAVHVNESFSSDSDEPLIVKQRKRSSGRKYNKNKFKARNNFICDICCKNCYTYQNYHHHLSLHAEDKSKKCIKCYETFKSRHALQDHIEKTHSSSKLTDTLKELLERRRKKDPKDRRSISEGFRKTICKVNTLETNAQAKIKPVHDALSVKKFIESFTPEDTCRDLKITSSVSLKVVEDVTCQPKIKMIKFCPEPLVYSRRLRMPTKFRDDGNSPVKVSIKVAREPISKSTFKVTSEVSHTDSAYTETGFYDNEITSNEIIMTTQDETNDEQRDDIPEVAQEVMLEDAEQTTSTESQRTIIIPNIPDAREDLRIGHLQPEAPFYKIVKMEDVMKTTEQPLNRPKTPDNITLPDGTKLVTVNPLAHLLQNTNVEEILKPTTKRYCEKTRDIRIAIKKAMTTLPKPLSTGTRKRRKTKQSVMNS